MTFLSPGLSELSNKKSLDTRYIYLFLQIKVVSNLLLLMPLFKSHSKLLVCSHEKLEQLIG